MSSISANGGVIIAFPHPVFAAPTRRRVERDRPHSAPSITRRARALVQLVKVVHVVHRAVVARRGRVEDGPRGQRVRGGRARRVGRAPHRADPGRGRLRTPVVLVEVRCRGR